MAPFLRNHSDGVYLAIKLQPRASENQIGEVMGSELKIKVTAPPVDAAANEALLRLLVERLDCPRGSIQITQGHRSRHKIIFVRGLSASVVEEKLTYGQ